MPLPFKCLILGQINSMSWSGLSLRISMKWQRAHTALQGYWQHNQAGFHSSLHKLPLVSFNQGMRFSRTLKKGLIYVATTNRCSLTDLCVHSQTFHTFADLFWLANLQKKGTFDYPHRLWYIFANNIATIAPPYLILFAPFFLPSCSPD